jgi:hypothetical protein
MFLVHCRRCLLGDQAETFSGGIRSTIPVWKEVGEINVGDGGSSGDGDEADDTECASPTKTAVYGKMELPKALPNERNGPGRVRYISSVIARCLSIHDIKDDEFTSAVEEDGMAESPLPPCLPAAALKARIYWALLWISESQAKRRHVTGNKFG